MGKKNVDELLKDAAELFTEKGKEYGDSYKRAGDIYSAFFQNGIELKTAEDFARFNTFSLCVMKMNRYAENLTKGGHLDSAKDLSVYAAILEWRTEDKGKALVRADCKFYNSCADRNFEVAIDFCNNPLNPENTEGNCRSEICPIRNEITWSITK